MHSDCLERLKHIYLKVSAGINMWFYVCETTFYIFDLIYLFRPPASSSHSSTDLGLFILFLAFSSLLQTGHYFLFFLLLQPRCMLGRWTSGSPSTHKPSGGNCSDRNLWDQGVWDRRRRATTEEERQSGEQGEREKHKHVAKGLQRFIRCVHAKETNVFRIQNICSHLLEELDTCLKLNHFPISTGKIKSVT